VHDPYWTPTAKHADIVVPSTTSLEREDLSCTRNDPLLVAMHAAAPRFAAARDDYDTFSALAHRLGFGDRFTEGRTARQWLEHLYEQWRGFVLADDARVESPPEFDEFWVRGHVRMRTEDELTLFEEFRADPQRNPLRTPSGRIEIFSADIDGFGYDDCAGHPAWFEPEEWLGGPRAQHYPLHLIANQPKTRLHSQLDHGGVSQASKIRGREPIRMHPADAAARGVAGGDVVRGFNDRGACLAGAVLDDGLMPGVVQLATGAWYDPLDPADPGSMCVHGNPNVLTADVGTSSLARGCTGQHALVQIERFDGDLPPIRAYDPPVIRTR
ncbi:MAG: molybdopterin-dependent oxidoreductase, partial [Rhodococcus sp. (in: high G+C Gram-positive bacteria)]|nr:molybdopterin-dependent oxidoreductase [Rhodococcus sp. (in: high G+C Gram-positive bacteria)]MDX5451516.1 molybdopterin-dependent oxidoreductase [Rhodococcus sp. (in: high G+C Gram-positive bacteria)]